MTDKPPSIDTFSNKGTSGKQIVPRPAGSTSANERYVVEHILEAQLLFKFLGEGGYSDLCDDMGEPNSGWYDTTVMPPIVAGQNNRSPWQYVADGFPYKSARDGRSGPTYPASHEDEFIYVLEPINLVKEFAFAGNEAIPGSSGMRAAVASEQTVDRAIRTMKNALLTYRYLTDSVIQDRLVTQATRVGDRMSEVEDVLRNNAQYTSEIQGMRGLWLTFVKSRTELAVSKLVTFLTLWLPEIERVLDGTDPAQDAQHPGRAVRRTKIEILRDAVDNRGRWSNPFGFAW